MKEGLKGKSPKCTEKLPLDGKVTGNFGFPASLSEFSHFPTVRMHQSEEIVFKCGITKKEAHMVSARPRGGFQHAKGTLAAVIMLHLSCSYEHFLQTQSTRAEEACAGRP